MYLVFFVSPIFGDLSLLPPTYIQVGENKILLDDSKILYTQLLKYNIYEKLDIFPRLWYIFQMSPIKSNKEAMTKVYHFLQEVN